MNDPSDRSAPDPGASAPQARTHHETTLRSYPPPPDPRRKSPGLAALLSIVPGLGQVYVGYYQRGFIHAVTAFSIIALLSTEFGGDALPPLLGPFLAFFWLYNIIDAGRRASLLNFALVGVEPIDLPSDFRAPGFGGSIAGGIALIAFGAWLVAKALRERAK